MVILAEISSAMSIRLWPVSDWHIWQLERRPLLRLLLQGNLQPIIGAGHSVFCKYSVLVPHRIWTFGSTNLRSRDITVCHCLELCRERRHRQNDFLFVTPHESACRRYRVHSLDAIEDEYTRPWMHLHEHGPSERGISRSWRLV